MPELSVEVSDMEGGNVRRKAGVQTSSNDCRNAKRDNGDGKWEKVKQYFQDCCKLSSIHGVRYFGEPRPSYYDKIWWAVAIVISCVFCVNRISYIYHKWQTSPVVITFETETTQIWQIPFPAVTICPQVKSNPKIFNYTSVYHKILDGQRISEKEMSYFNHMSLICQEQDVNMTLYAVEHEEMFGFFKNVTFQLQESIKDISFMREFYKFDDVFVPVITDDGVCYSFNILDVKDIYTDVVKPYTVRQTSTTRKSSWSLEKGYEKTAGIDAYPRRALFAEASWSLDLDLVFNASSMDFACTSGVLGFKVQIHHPAEIPRVREKFFRVPFNQIITAAISPGMTTSDDVKDYAPEKRKCFYTSERTLRFYKFYTQENCMMECKANYTLKYCECVNFFMPHDDETLICSAASMNCTREAEKDFVIDHIETKLELSNVWIKEKSEYDGYVHDCNCLPVCSSLEYSIELSQDEWNWEKHFEVERYLDGNHQKFSKKDYHASHLTIFFKTDQFFPLRRSPVYDTTDFLAQCGGLLGLFIGFSVLSFVEIIYFLSVRLLCNRKRLLSSQDGVRRPI